MAPTILSPRTEAALEVLRAGGQFVRRLERNRYTRRVQWEYRLIAADRSIVRGIGGATHYDLLRAGLIVMTGPNTSASIVYGLRSTTTTEEG